MLHADSVLDQIEEILSVKEGRPCLLVIQEELTKLLKFHPELVERINELLAKVKEELDDLDI